MSQGRAPISHSACLWGIELLMLRKHHPGRIRGRKGVALRRLRLANEPWCRDCKHQGKNIRATVPDHIVPLAKGGSDDQGNIRCLCRDCHRIRTAEQFGYRKPFSRIDDDGWPT